MKRIICVVGGFVAIAVGGQQLIHSSHGKDPRSEKWPHIDQTQYVGAKKCAECHQTYYESWKDTAHNKMIRTEGGRPRPNDPGGFQQTEPAAQFSN